MTGIWSDEAGSDDDPLVVLVHGSMDRAAGMLRVSRLLDHRLRVLRYDRRGYGRSAPHGGPFAMDDQVADLVALLRGRPAVLVGHSYGGNVALAVAACHPELVAGVAVFESPQSWEPWWPSGTAGSRAIDAGADPAYAAEVFMRRLIGDAHWEALPERTRETRRREGAVMVAELADLRTHRPWEAAAITVPVVAGYGALGSAHHHRGMQHLAQAIPGAVAVELLGCRHNAPSVHAALFCDEVVEPLLAAVGPPWSTA